MRLLPLLPKFLPEHLDPFWNLPPVAHQCIDDETDENEARQKPPEPEECSHDDDEDGEAQEFHGVILQHNLGVQDNEFLLPHHDGIQVNFPDTRALGHEQ